MLLLPKQREGQGPGGGASHQKSEPSQHSARLRKPGGSQPVTGTGHFASPTVVSIGVEWEANSHIMKL